jgi:arsenate reductase
VKTVLFVCVHNSGRSQMAEALFNQMAETRAVAISAGTKPASRVNPVVTEAMREIGMDISHKTPKLLTLEMLEKADRVITMGCDVEETCPASFVPTEDWELGDPEGKPLEEIREIRDEIKTRVEKLLAESEEAKEAKGL